MQLERNVPLADMTSFGCGGKAAWFLRALTMDALKFAMLRAAEMEAPLLILGGGTNILVSDDGVKAVVVKPEGDFSRLEYREGIISAGAGVSSISLHRFCIERGLSGLEGLFGIPGTVGGAVFCNAGVPSISIGDVVSEMEILGRDGKLKRLKASECGFAYRSSNIAGIITRVWLKVVEADREKVLKAIAVAKEKRPKFPHLSTAGCVFRNPESDFAGRLLDAAGLKGERRGGARVFAGHANVIVNEGGTAMDVFELMCYCRQRVLEKFGINLEPEIKLWGLNEQFKEQR